jgi:general secretion pathway protein D
MPATQPAQPPVSTPASAPPPIQGNIALQPNAPGLARPNAGPATPVLLFKPSASEVARNAAVTVELQIDNVSELFSAPMRLKYDNKVLKLVEVQRGAFLGGDGQQITFSDSKVEETGTAIINMNRVPGAGGISGSGTLLTLKFVAIGPGVSPVRFEEVTLRDARLETIAVTPPAVAVTVK